MSHLITSSNTPPTGFPITGWLRFLNGNARRIYVSPVNPENNNLYLYGFLIFQRPRWRQKAQAGFKTHFLVAHPLL
jgi:hypothetical protein